MVSEIESLLGVHTRVRMLSVIDETMREVVKYDIYNRTARLQMTRFHSFSWEYDS